MSSPHSVRWGILATGWIAEKFTKDLMIDPSTRDVSDIRHSVVAAASSSSADRAKKFLEECKCSPSAKAYGSYEELVKDKDVDIIYVATPHSHHYQNTMLCLLAGKNVLCEKAFTTNAAQAKKLVELAKEKKLFMMEAVWTRFFPLSVKIRNLIESGKLGSVHRVIADLSFGEDVEKEWGTTHRMVNKDLAGGALLDRKSTPFAPEPVTKSTLYHVLPPQQRKPPTVASQMIHYDQTGVDESTSILLTFPSAPNNPKPAMGIALTNLRVATDPDGKGIAGPAIRIQGTKGELQVNGPAFRPTHWRLISRDDDDDGNVEEHDEPIPGHGMFWEADACARALRDGKLECETMGWEESVVIMEVMDEVRMQGNLTYPEKIETCEYPVRL